MARSDFWSPRVASFDFERVERQHPHLPEMTLPADKNTGYVVVIPQAFGYQLSVSFFGENTRTMIVTGGHKMNVSFVAADVDSPIKYDELEVTNANILEQFVLLLPEYVRGQARTCIASLLKGN